MPDIKMNSNLKRPIKVAFVVVDDRFTISSPLPLFGAAPTALLQGFEEMANEIEVHVVCCTMGDHPKPEKLAENIWFHSEPVPKWGFLRSLHLGCLLSVHRMIRQIQPDIVHAQGTERWCAVSTVLLPYPKILTIHGNLAAIFPTFKPQPRVYWWLQTVLQKVTLPHFDGVFCNSNYTEKHLVRDAKHTWRVDNPVRNDFFIKPHSSKTTDVPIILNVGVFQPRKRQLELLQMADKLFHDGIIFRMRFIGKLLDDPYGRECKILIEKGEKLGFAEYIGCKTSQELVTEMDKANGFVHFPTEEAFGLVVVECLARGLKFFGSAVGGIVDITQDIKSCELYDKDDWKGLADGISRWIANGAPRSCDSADIMSRKYHPIVIARQHLTIYQDLLSSKSQSSNR